MQVDAGPPAILLDPPAKFGLAGTCRGPLFASGLAQAYLLSPAASAGKPRRHSWPNCESPPRGAASYGPAADARRIELRAAADGAPPSPWTSVSSSSSSACLPARPRHPPGDRSRRPARDRSVSPAVVSAPPRSNLARALAPSARSAGLGFGSWKKLDPSFFRFSLHLPSGRRRRRSASRPCAPPPPPLPLAVRAAPSLTLAMQNSAKSPSAPSLPPSPPVRAATLASVPAPSRA